MGALGVEIVWLESGHGKLEEGSQHTAVKPAAEREFPNDFSDSYRAIITAVRPFTMTSNDKLHALITATQYIHDHAIAGDIVECGVWRGSMHAVARVLDAANDHTRDLYLFDTFEGMPPPTEKGRRLDGRSAADLLATHDRETTIWAHASPEDIKAGFETVPYPQEPIHYVQGKVEDTVAGECPEANRPASTGHRLVRVDPPRTRAPLPTCGQWRCPDH